MSTEPPEVARALAAFPELRQPRVRPLSGGLINQSFSVRDLDVEYVLQRVSPIFSKGIHANIQAVTEHLRGHGVAAPRLCPTGDGRPCADLGEAGLWRLMSRMPGVSFDTCTSPAQARAAGALVARFHGALEDFDRELQPIGIALHDTAAYLADLAAAVDRQRTHRLYDPVASLAEKILATSAEWPGLGDLPSRVIHGDLKFNNVLFAGDSGPSREEAVCLIDLDTLSRMALWMDLGDALRSWCNRRGEDAPEAQLDMQLFAATLEGYLAALPIALGAAERASLAEGLERMSLELAARFAADALAECYFGWDPARFPAAGEHNLVRALGQFSLSRQAHAARSEQLRLVGV